MPTTLGAELRRLGITATQIGRALLGSAPTKQTAYSAGARFLGDERDPHLSRVAALAGALGVEIRVLPSGDVQVFRANPAKVARGMASMPYTDGAAIAED